MSADAWWGIGVVVGVLLIGLLVVLGTALKASSDADDKAGYP